MAVASLASLRMGMSALRMNPMRSVLSTLGVIMGAGSLVAVLSLGDGMERFAREQIAGEGLQVVTLTARQFDMVDGQRLPRTDVATLGVDDATALQAAVGARGVVSITVDGPATLEGTRVDPRRRAALVAGLGLAPIAVTTQRHAAGRALTPAELRGSAPVTVVSWALAKALVPAGASPASLVGDSIRLQGAWRRVVGVRAEERLDRRMVAVVPIGIADASMTPLPAGAVRPRTIVAQAATLEDAAALKAGVEAWVQRAKGAAWRERYDVGATGAKRLEDMQRGVLLFKMLMGAFTGISLVVGGIGIMNVLLASVAERTREIGIRKAVGARGRDILAQFLAESVTITGIGSALGAALGLAAAYGFTAVMRAKTQALVYASVSWATVLVAALAAVLVGLVFGTYPALRAARLVPIDAIHTD